MDDSDSQEKLVTQFLHRTINETFLTFLDFCEDVSYDSYIYVFLCEEKQLTDLVSQKIAIVEKNLNEVRPLREALSKLKKLLEAQKELEREYSPTFELLGRNDLTEGSLERPQQYTESAIEELQDCDEGLLEEPETAIDEAFLEILEDLGFSAFLDSRVTDLLQQVAKAKVWLPETHRALQRRRVAEGNASNVTADIYHRDITVKLPFNLNDLDEILMAKVTVAVVPLLKWFESLGKGSTVVVYGYNSDYSASLASDENGYTVKLKSLNPEHLDLLSELRDAEKKGKSFRDFSKLVRYLVEINDELRIRNRV